MKLVHIISHFEFQDRIEGILDRHDISCFVRVPMVQSRDRDGKHMGSKVFPGNSSLVMAQVQEDKVDDLLASLDAFRQEKEAHLHLQAVVLSVEQQLGSVEGCEKDASGKENAHPEEN
ncbi:MAG: PG0541 family transporter-associated protein [Desulfohalobiaceae bacterium]